jgi:hypothetical protein
VLRTCLCALSLLLLSACGDEGSTTRQLASAFAGKYNTLSPDSVHRLDSTASITLVQQTRTRTLYLFRKNGAKTDTFQLATDTSRVNNAKLDTAQLDGNGAPEILATLHYQHLSGKGNSGEESERVRLKIFDPDHKRVLFDRTTEFYKRSWGPNLAGQRVETRSAARMNITAAHDTLSLTLKIKTDDVLSLPVPQGKYVLQKDSLKRCE